MTYTELNDIEKNILFGSILGDGTLTKITGRRINSNYRESFGQAQLEYREWKVEQLERFLYFNPSKTAISSKSLPLFTNLEKLFYTDNRVKRIPQIILKDCTLPYFLVVLYLDDGSLSVSYRVNHRLKKIYLTPHIYLYLQSFTEPELVMLQGHLNTVFGVNLVTSSRKDGTGIILKTTAVAETFAFLDVIGEITKQIPSMTYKCDWPFRFEQESRKWSSIHPNYEILTSNRERSKAYSQIEIEQMLELKSAGYTDQQIAEQLGRSYWSVIYKLRDIRENH